VTVGPNSCIGYARATTWEGGVSSPLKRMN